MLTYIWRMWLHVTATGSSHCQAFLYIHYKLTPVINPTVLHLSCYMYTSYINVKSYKLSKRQSHLVINFYETEGGSSNYFLIFYYVMTRYDIYLLRLGFHLVAVVSRLVQK